MPGDSGCLCPAMLRGTSVRTLDRQRQPVSALVGYFAPLLLMPLSLPHLSPELLLDVPCGGPPSNRCLELASLDSRTETFFETRLDSFFAVAAAGQQGTSCPRQRYWGVGSALTARPDFRRLLGRSSPASAPGVAGPDCRCMPPIWPERPARPAPAVAGADPHGAPGVHPDFGIATSDSWSSVSERVADGSSRPGWAAEISPAGLHHLLAREGAAGGSSSADAEEPRPLPLRAFCIALDKQMSHSANRIPEILRRGRSGFVFWFCIINKLQSLSTQNHHHNYNYTPGLAKTSRFGHLSMQRIILYSG